MKPLKRLPLRSAIPAAAATSIAQHAHAQSQATQTLLEGLTEIYLLLKVLLILLSVFSIIAIAVYGYRGQIPWGWITSLAFSAALLFLAPYVLEHTIDYNPIDTAATPNNSQANIQGQNPVPSIQPPGQPNIPAQPSTYQDRMSDAIRDWCFNNGSQDYDALTQCTEQPWFHDTDNDLITLPQGLLTSVCSMLGLCATPPTIPFQG